MLNHCIAILCGLFLLISPIEISANNSDKNHIAVEKINADPSILNDKHLKQVELNGLNLRDAIIKNLILEDVKTIDAKFTNITFENCTFIKADIRAVFSNVAFKNCRFLSLDDSFHHTKITRFDESVFDNVLFEDTEFVHVDLGGIHGNGGYVLFKNVAKAIPRGEAPFMDISDAEVRIDNSIIHGVIAGEENVNSITKNSKYIKGGIYCGHNFVMNSSTEDGNQFGSSKTLVIKDSIVDGNAIIHGNGYLLHNTYIPGIIALWGGATIVGGFGIHVEENGHAYVIAKNDEPTALRLFGGDITLKNFTLTNTIIGSSLESTPDINALNLQNVIIRGGEWDGKILGGKWENVRIEPSVSIGKPEIRNIQAYRLEFPKASPWSKYDVFEFDVTESPTPFEWPEIKAPTPEDIGLVWWPKVEPGYRGNP